MRILGSLFTSAFFVHGCTAIHTTPQLDHELDAAVQSYASGSTQTFWTELVPSPRYHSHLGMLTLGILPTWRQEKSLAHLRLEWPDRVPEKGRLEVTRESIHGWFAWCWWFSSEWEMGSLFSERSPHEARIQTTLLRMMAEADEGGTAR